MDINSEEARAWNLSKIDGETLSAGACFFFPQNLTEEMRVLNTTKEKLM
jgi:hypothetical protein